MKKLIAFIFVLSMITALFSGCRVDDDEYYAAANGSESGDVSTNDTISEDISSNDETSAEDDETFTSKIETEHLFQAKMAAGGYAHTITLREDGTVWGWGYDFYGCINSGKPVQIKGLSDIVYVAAGNYASAAIKSDGTLFMWGAGWTATGSMNRYLLNLEVPLMNDVIDVSIGNYFTAVLKNDGSVWIFGVNGTDNAEQQKVPKKVEGLPKIKQIATSWYHAAFLDEDGNVWFLEEQYITPRVPKKIDALSNITKIVGGGHHFVALKGDGNVCTFSESDNPDYVNPKIEGLSDIVDVTAGAVHSIAVKNDGTVWSWGFFEHGLGDRKSFESKTPVQVVLPVKATGVASGNWHAIITTPDGLWSWGNNYMGQLGYGYIPDDKNNIDFNRSKPVQVRTIDISEEEAKKGDKGSPRLIDILNPNGFVATDLDDILQSIDLNDSDIVKYYDPDPSEFLPLYPPFLKMDEDTLFGILRTVKKYDWETYGESLNALTTSACVITVVCNDTVMTYLQFARDEQGRCYVYSMYDKRIAYLSETDFNEIREKFETAPEWPGKYFERYGYRHYSEYKGNTGN